MISTNKNYSMFTFIEIRTEKLFTQNSTLMEVKLAVVKFLSTFFILSKHFNLNKMSWWIQSVSWDHCNTGMKIHPEWDVLLQGTMHAHILTYGQFSIANLLISVLWDSGRKPEKPAEN